jgi:hypothetical protein
MCALPTPSGVLLHSSSHDWRYKAVSSALAVEGVIVNDCAQEGNFI